jgi:hypothetical protein
MKVMQLLQANGLEIVRASDMQEAILLTGVNLNSDDDLKSLAKELALTAIVTGEVGPNRAKIVVHDGSDGSVLGDASFTGANPRKLAEEVGETFWERLGPSVENGRLPAGAKGVHKPPARAASEESGQKDGDGLSKPNDSAPPEGSESDEAPASQKTRNKRRFKMEEEPPEEASAGPVPPGNPWLDFELGVGGLNRSLTFNQNVSVQGAVLLRPYTLAFGPIGVANVVLFPWLAEKVGNFGVEAQIRQGFGVSSTLPGGQSFGASVHEYTAGFRYRVLFATTDDVFFSLNLGEDAFTFNGPNRSSLPTPDTIYHYTRVGAGMHLAITDRIGISFGAGYRYINNRGGVQISQDIFPRLSVAGADADIGSRYAVNETFEVRAGLGWRRYWYAMNSQVGDRVAASGAVDQSFVFTAGIAVLLGVSSTPAPEGGAEAPPPPPPPAHDARPRKTPFDHEESSPNSESADPSTSVDPAGGRKSGRAADE